MRRNPPVRTSTRRRRPAPPGLRDGHRRSSRRESPVRLIGLSREFVLELLGPAGFVRRDGPVQILALHRQRLLPRRLPVPRGRRLPRQSCRGPLQERRADFGQQLLSAPGRGATWRRHGLIAVERHRHRLRLEGAQVADHAERTVGLARLAHIAAVGQPVMGVAAVAIRRDPVELRLDQPADRRRAQGRCGSTPGRYACRRRWSPRRRRR